MSRMSWTHKIQGVRFVVCMAVVALIVSLASCKKPDDSKASKRPSRHQRKPEPRFWKLPNPATRPPCWRFLVLTGRRSCFPEMP